MGEYHSPPKCQTPTKWQIFRFRFSPIWIWRRRITPKLQWIRGEFWCSRRHRPLFRDIGGCGGRDVWGRKRKSYWGLRCPVCRNTWETTRPAKPLTRQQQAAIADSLGNMWIGGDGSFCENDVSPDDIEAISEELGMYPGAWDMVEPKLIIAACWSRLNAIRNERRAQYDGRIA